MLKKTAPLLLMLTTLEATASDDNSCASIMCLFGELTGQGGGKKCEEPIRKFFEIKVEEGGLMGGMDPVQTKIKRETFLKDECESGQGEGGNEKLNEKIDQIIEKFGEL